MATPPLPAPILNRMAARQQSVRWVAQLREVREFRAYVCNINASTIMGITYPPVPIIIITPNPVCLGVAISWDVSVSYAPNGTISTYSTDFGDASAPSAATSGTHTYGAAGTYTVTVTVTDDTGESQTGTVEVNVVDCTSTLFLDYIYASTDGSGVFYWE